MISSQAGGLEVGASMPFNHLPYGVSKAAENFLARKLHTDHASDGLSELCGGLMRTDAKSHREIIPSVVFPICPGAVETDMSEYQLSCDLSPIRLTLFSQIRNFVRNKTKRLAAASSGRASMTPRSTYFKSWTVLLVMDKVVNL
jgi:NAD(P)-dependent dehydrogenase (short-subunit alcohol dehydrogenase family)